MVLGSIEGGRGEVNKGPQLVNGSYAERTDSFLGSKYEWVESSFEFDKDLFLNEPFVCVNAEQSCPELECVPCDWSTPGVCFSFFFFFLFFFFLLFGFLFLFSFFFFFFFFFVIF